MLRIMILSILMLSLGGCSALDRYQARFDTVSTGQSVRDVLAVMNSDPDDIKEVSFLGMSAKKMVWQSEFSDKKYTVIVVNDHVVSKVLL